MLKVLVKTILYFEALLLLPFIASFLTEEINWSLLDYIMMALLLAFFATAIVFITNKFENLLARKIAIIIIFLVFLLIWAELAVGIF